MKDSPGSRLLVAGVCLIGGIGLLGLPVETAGQLRYFGGGILIALALLFMFGRRTL
jgi:hypothetical protein